MRTVSGCQSDGHLGETVHRRWTQFLEDSQFQIPELARSKLCKGLDSCTDRAKMFAKTDHTLNNEHKRRLHRRTCSFATRMTDSTEVQRYAQTRQLFCETRARAKIHRIHVTAYRAYNFRDPELAIFVTQSWQFSWPRARNFRDSQHIFLNWKIWLVKTNTSFLAWLPHLEMKAWQRQIFLPTRTTAARGSLEDPIHRMTKISWNFLKDQAMWHLS